MGSGYEPRLIFQRDKIKSVRESFTEQYRNWNDEREFFGGPRIGEVRAHLASLDLETCALEDLGFLRHWGELKCSVCDGVFEMLVRIGEEPNYEARWVDVCEADLRKAVSLLAKPVPA